MPPKKATTRKTKKMKGGSIFTKIRDALIKGHKFIKDKKLISTLAGPIGMVTGNPAVGTAIAGIAKHYGYGKRKGKTGGAFYVGQKPLGRPTKRRPVTMPRPIIVRPVIKATGGAYKVGRVGSGFKVGRGATGSSSVKPQRVFP